MRLLALSLLLLVMAGVAAAGFRRRPALGALLFRLLFAAAAVTGAVPALAVLGGATVADARVATRAPFGAWVFGLDSLSAVFVLANGKHRRCDAPGQKAAAVFRVHHGKIVSWEQVPVPQGTGPTA